MTDFHARTRRNRGGWLDQLLVDQSVRAEGANLDDLRDFIEASDRTDHVLVAVDNPAPARGYAIVLRGIPAPEPTALARMHMISGQPEAAYRALFSAAMVAARPAGNRVSVKVDTDTLSDDMLRAVRDYGADYGISLTASEHAQEAREVSVPPSEVPEVVEAGESGGDDAPEASTAADSSDSSEAELGLSDLADGKEPADTESVNEAERTEQVSDTDRFECFDCGRSFSTPQGLGKHSRSCKKGA